MPLMILAFVLVLVISVIYAAVGITVVESLDVILVMFAIVLVLII